MKKLNPRIKFNGGNPVAICNRCAVIMCRVSCLEEDGDFCKVLKPNTDYTKALIGEKPPIYCDKCANLLRYIPQ